MCNGAAHVQYIPSSKLLIIVWQIKVQYLAVLQKSTAVTDVVLIKWEFQYLKKQSWWLSAETTDNLSKS